ncbi:MAG: S-layer homology domain-containing protein [Defluviitaleaceae bacterium]|nr:S-layer homology domain-containing protein [Defluviitaleaceae bacterium]MCL2261744.1 S-layer homology domain-containing protein [Defluviitaleaceae bacterium]
MRKTKLLAVFLAVVMAFGLLPAVISAGNEGAETPHGFAFAGGISPAALSAELPPEEETEDETPVTWQYALADALGWLKENSPNPSVGDEWAVIALARANIAADEWFEAYLSNVADEIETLTNWTCFQRVTLALTALDVDASDFNETDLLAPFRYFTPVEERPNHSQGITADIYALIALNSRPYEGEQERFMESILAAQGEDGAWAWVSEWGDWPSVDLTAMAIQALAPYYETHENAAAAINAGLDWISEQFFFGAEDFAQVIVALTSIGRCAEEHAAEILNFFCQETGGFFFFDWETGEPIVNAMSTEQAAYALVAFYRHVNGMNTLYDMSDAGEEAETQPPPRRRPRPPQDWFPSTGRAFISVRNDYARAGETALFFEGYFDLNHNETAYSLLRRTGLAIGSRRAYVYSIGGLAEFDHGPASGWTYSVNGVFPARAADTFTLRNNYRVEWLYTGGDTPLVSEDEYEEDEEEYEYEDLTEEETPAEEEPPYDTEEPTRYTEPAQAPLPETPTPEAYQTWANPFADISETDWFYQYAKAMYTRGLMTGTAHGVFAPDTNLSRAMLIHILWRLNDTPITHSPDFSDVSPARWYTNAARWARANGIARGFTDGTFRPNAPITQAHFAAVLYNYAALDLTPHTNHTITRAEAARMLRVLID